MKRNLKRIGYLLTITIVLVSFIDMLNNACAQGPGQSLDWSIKANKTAFYAGEPILLTLNIRSTGTQEEKVNFGMDGLEAFSMEIHDSNNIIVSKGDKIQRFGVSRVGTLLVTPGETGQKSIVLNRWCSTLLPPGQYRVVCRIDRPGKFYFEKIKSGDQIVVVTKRHYEPMTVLELDIQIIEMDRVRFKEMLETLVGFEVKPEAKSKREWLTERDIARELLALTESELAIPYQLQLLRTDPYTWFGPDAINSLVKSGTLEAARGLVQIIEDPSIYTVDVESIFIDGVYRLRETGKAEIINATDEFVAKYKRPVLAKPND